MVTAIALAICAAFVGTGVLCVLLVLSLVIQDALDAYKARKHDAAMERIITTQAEKQPR